MKFTIPQPFFFILVCFSGELLAHSGRTDSDGCHAGSKPYHCHNKKNSPVSDLEEIRRKKILKGTITHVRDGDTFEVNGIPVRLAALDCPENNTKEGRTASQIAKKFKGAKAVCELTGAKTYDRLVGYCEVAEADFGKMMMNNSQCKVWRKYDIWDRY
tara:strand:- start:314 stop:787 length:474 start_codon:yes stop_codon:yes gene_type:complete